MPPRALPPFAAVRAFEAIVRNGSMRLAADELRLSVSALSHQLKSLETYLDTLLFMRTNGAMKLTAGGKAYANDLTRALDIIAAASAEAEGDSRHAVTINLSPSMAAMWLLPRLTNFRKLAPTIDVRVITTLDPLDPQLGIFDFAIRYASDRSRASNMTQIFVEQVFPVCAPTNQYAQGGLDLDPDLSNATLITCQTQPREWPDWFTFSGFTGRRPTRTIDVDTRVLALEAATDGLGIAMGRTPFVNRPLIAGRLVRASKKTFADGHGYYLVSASESLRKRSAKTFAEWIVAEAAQLEPIPSP